MKKQLVFLILFVLMLPSCSSLQSVADKEQKALQMKAKVESDDFTFEPLNARSLSFNLIHLSSGYSLKISKDTLKVYLPYFGRAYTAPLNSTEGGITFISTRFERKLVMGKRPGNWQLNYKTLDTEHPILLYLEVWDNGTAHLNVNDSERQSIAFDGYIE